MYGFGERHKGPQASVVLHGYDQAKAKGEIRLFESHRADVPHGHQSRDFVDVSDAVEAMWFALKKAGDLRDLQRRNRQGAHVSGPREGRLQGARRARANRLRPDPEAIRTRYQYFTEAKMDRLQGAGFEKPVGLEDGVDWYVRRLDHTE